MIKFFLTVDNSSPVIVAGSSGSFGFIVTPAWTNAWVALR
jgi:hypothetical protein